MTVLVVRRHSKQYMSNFHNHAEYNENVGQSFNLNLGKGREILHLSVFLMEQD